MKAISCHSTCFEINEEPAHHAAFAVCRKGFWPNICLVFILTDYFQIQKCSNNKIIIISQCQFLAAFCFEERVVLWAKKAQFLELLQPKKII